MLQSVFTHAASIYANLLEQKEAFAFEKRSTPHSLFCGSNSRIQHFLDTSTNKTTEVTLHTGFWECSRRVVRLLGFRSGALELHIYF